MKVQCAQCKEVVALGRFRIDGDVIEVSCPECKATYRISAETGEVGGPPPQPSPRKRGEGEDACPKCGKPVAVGAGACAACGLLRDRFAEFAATRPPEPEDLAAAWTACREHWDDPAAHDRYLDAVATAQAFGAAARRYHDVLRDAPGDERARRGVDRVTRMAQAALLGSPASVRQAAKTPEPYKNVVLLLLVLVALGGIFGIYGLFRARDAREQLERDQGGSVENPRDRPPLKRSSPARPR